MWMNFMLVPHVYIKGANARMGNHRKLQGVCLRPTGKKCIQQQVTQHKHERRHNEDLLQDTHFRQQKELQSRRDLFFCTRGLETLLDGPPSFLILRPVLFLNFLDSFISLHIGSKQARTALMIHTSENLLYIS